MKRLMVFLSVFTFLAFLSCRKFETTPYKDFQGSESRLNEKNILKLKQQSQESDTLRIVFIGDTQRFYEPLERLVNKVNGFDKIDFLIMAGDITDFGTAEEFGWITRQLNRLKMPSFWVVGNHDLIANGAGVYDQVFGDRNFSFVYKGYKFIFHDTNSREYNFNGQVPDLDFLAKELNDDSVNYFLGVAHVPPYTEDFDPRLEQSYQELFGSERRFIAALYGHLHGYKKAKFYNDHVNYIVSPAVVKNEALLLTMVKGDIHIKTFKF